MTLNEVIILIFSSLLFGSIVALAALGIVLIFRTSKATNFAQGTIGTMNAFIAGYFVRVQGYSFWVALIIALIAAFLTGIIIDKLFIRPAHKANIVSKQILTLGIIMILVGIMSSPIGILGTVFPSQVYRPSPFISQAERVMIFGAQIQWYTIVVFLVTIALLALIFWFIQKTRWGLATRVTASNEPTARLMGVPTKSVTMMSWAVAAMLGTLAGIFYAPVSSEGLAPTLLINIQIGAFFAGVFGGFSTFHGPVIAAYLIGFMLSMGRYFGTSTLGIPSTVYADVFVYLTILIILYFRPYGLFGKKPIRKV